MQNTSTVGIPKNCMNWLVLGLTIYTDMEIKDALKEHFGLSDRKKIKGRVDVDKLKALTKWLVIWNKLSLVQILKLQDRALWPLEHIQRLLQLMR